ncbi:MAG: EfeM/EfeO family lipoprotein [Nocardioides sp.]|uniref:imelysin family protein n=1 Tax=Nocardioides sp. TaxID=35761 RepID=UPI0039E6C3E5
MDEQDTVEAGSSQQRRDRAGWRRWPALVLVAVVVLTAVAIVVRATHGGSSAEAEAPHADESIAGEAVTVGVDTCGGQWDGGEAGPLSLALWNNSIQPIEVYLEQPSTKKVYLDAENLGAGATRHYTVTLGPGTYRFYCMPSDADPVTGQTWKLTGSYSGQTTPGMVPVTVNDLIPRLDDYIAWVRGQLPSLRRQAKRLDADVRAGDLAAAKGDWLTAHLHYETLGAAYDAFGDDGDAIDASPSVGVDPVTDPDLAGFHKIEALLWAGRPAAAIRPHTAALVTAIDHLHHDLVNPVLTTQMIGLRAHEILEDAVKFELTGLNDAGSGTGLATIDANLDGTVHALKPIRSLLTSRDPDLAETYAWIARSRKLVESYHTDGRWRGLDSLTERQREELNATLDQTVELLSEVAVITDPRRSR